MDHIFLPFLKIAVTYPVFQSEGNWFKLYEVSNNIFRGSIIVRVVIHTIYVDVDYQDLEILLL